MLYTKKGDDGKTGLFHCDQRFSKSSAIAEALGSLDELNSFLGLIKAKSNQGNTSQSRGISLIIQNIQENLFIIQAGLAGSDKIITEDKVEDLEDEIAKIEEDLPPIKTFSIPGATVESAELDFARTLARKTERQVVAVLDEGLVTVSANTLAYLNRLSSLLFALARQNAHKSGINESAPSYK